MEDGRQASLRRDSHLYQFNWTLDGKHFSWQGREIWSLKSRLLSNSKWKSLKGFTPVILFVSEAAECLISS